MLLVGAFDFETCNAATTGIKSTMASTATQTVTMMDSIVDGENYALAGMVESGGTSEGFLVVRDMSSCDDKISLLTREVRTFYKLGMEFGGNQVVVFGLRPNAVSGGEDTVVIGYEMDTGLANIRYMATSDSVGFYAYASKLTNNMLVVAGR